MLPRTPLRLSARSLPLTLTVAGFLPASVNGTVKLFLVSK